MKEGRVEGKVTTRLEVNIKNLKGDTRGGERAVASELHPPFGDGVERNVGPGVVSEERECR